MIRLTFSTQCHSWSICLVGLRSFFFALTLYRLEASGPSIAELPAPSPAWQMFGRKCTDPEAQAPAACKAAATTAIGMLPAVLLRRIASVAGDFWPFELPEGLASAPALGSTPDTDVLAAGVVAVMQSAKKVTSSKVLLDLCPPLSARCPPEVAADASTVITSPEVDPPSAEATVGLTSCSLVLQPLVPPAPRGVGAGEGGTVTRPGGDSKVHVELHLPVAGSAAGAAEAAAAKCGLFVWLPIPGAVKGDTGGASGLLLAGCMPMLRDGAPRRRVVTWPAEEADMADAAICMPEPRCWCGVMLAMDVSAAADTLGNGALLDAGDASCCQAARGMIGWRQSR